MTDNQEVIRPRASIRSSRTSLSSLNTSDNTNIVDMCYALTHLSTNK